MKRQAKALSTVTLFLAIVLAATSSQALAAPDTYFRVGEFATTLGAGPGQLDQPGKIAVDSDTGHIYVVDSNNDRVQVFAPTANSAEWLTTIEAGFDHPYGIAIDQAASPIAVYVSDSGNDRIVKLKSNGASTPSFSVDGSFVSPAAGTSNPGEVGSFGAALAVDPTPGDLLLADEARQLVQRFGPDGAFKGAFAAEIFPAVNGRLGNDIAVSPSGSIALLAHGNVGVAGVREYDSAGNLEQSYLRSTEPRALAIDPDSGDVVISGGSLSNPPTRIWRYTDPDSTAIVGFPDIGFSLLWALAIDGGPSGRLYAVVDDSFGSCPNGCPGLKFPSIQVLEPATRPSVAFDPISPSEIGSTTVTVRGTINPEGTETTWRPELSTDGVSWNPTPSDAVGAGNAPVTVERQVTGLRPNTTYFVRLSATNPPGTKVSAVQTIETDQSAPLLEPRGAAPLTRTTARLNGLVNPFGLPTTYHFEYGPSDCDSNPCTAVPPAEDGDAGAGSDSVLVSEEIGGLQPDTTYHYRVVTENSVGQSAFDGTFRTLGASPPARGVELVSNPDKGNQDARVFGLSPDRDEVVWGVLGGAPGTPAGSQGSFLATRTSAGWKSKGILPPIDQLFGGGSLNFQYQISSENFDRHLFIASSGLFSENPRTFVRIDLSGSQDVLQEMPSNTPVIVASDSSVSGDLEHIFYKTPQRIDPSHKAGTRNVYDFGVIPPRLVSRMPATGAAPPCGVVEGTGPSFTQRPYPPHTTAPGAEKRVFFHTRGSSCSGPWQLYARDLSEPTAELISGPPISGPDEGGDLVRVSPDGTEALFVSRSKLDPDDENVTADLYRWVLGEGRSCQTCSVPEASLIGLADVHQRTVVPSSDFSYVYFLSTKTLVPGLGENPGPKIYQLHGGEIDYVAPAANLDSLFPLGNLSADGSVLLFETGPEKVTGDLTVGEQQELIRYDADGRTLECVSCRHGSVTESNVDRPYMNSQGGRGSPQVTDDGQIVVFQTQDALVAEDINGTADVYEWRNGHVMLVSDGETEFPTGDAGLRLQAMSDDGMNILFVSGSVALTGHEQDSMAQVYAAHIGGGFPPPPIPPAPCTEDACQGPLDPAPALRDAASAGFAGPGNQSRGRKRARPNRRCAKRKGRSVHKVKGACRKGSAKRNADKPRGKRNGRASR